MTFRALDANLDRAAEGLRVLEGVARFSLNDTSLTEKLRLLRHRIRGVGTLINTQLMSARDASGDVGAGAVQCAAAGGLFLVNDHLDLVLASGAQGLHVGQTDIPVPVARHLLPVDRLLGVSAKARAQALAAQDGGGRLCGRGGHVSHHLQSGSCGKRAGGALHEVRDTVSLPVVAIGGINQDNVDQVVRAGADAIAVINAVLGAPDVERATADLVKAMEEAKNGIQ